MDYSNINDALNAAENIKLSVVSLSGVTEYEVTPGMTIADFKARHGLGDVRVVNKEGVALANTATINESTELFIATPKRNG